MALGIPTAMLGTFMLSTGFYIFDSVGIQLVAASPFIGGGFSLAMFYLNELNKLQNKKPKANFNYLVNSFNVKSEDNNIFWSNQLKVPIGEEHLLRFCKIGCRRQAKFYGNYTLLENQGSFKKLSKNEVWSNFIFTQRQNPRFLPEEVWSCKMILQMTGLFRGWKQGSAGLAYYDNPQTLVNVASRRWEIMQQPPTSKNIFKHHLIQNTKNRFGLL